MDSQLRAPVQPIISSSRGEPREDFDINKMGGGFKAAIFNWLSNYPQREWLCALLRRCKPIVDLPGMTLVLRDEDVREVLAHDREFPVPFGVRMKRVTGQENFVLGMENDADYQCRYQQLVKAFKRDDVATHVVPIAARISEQILQGRQQLDAMRELLWTVPVRLCEEYFGIRVDNPQLFAEWSMALSGYLFSPGEPSKQDEALMQQASLAFRKLLRASIVQTRSGQGRGVVLPRLIEMQTHDAHLTDAVLEAHLFGMVTGFVPTNLLAAGNILDTLLRRDDFMADARRAALGNDDARLWRSLQETLRFRHINPGPVRTVGKNGYTLAAGTFREKYLEPGRTVIASTQSAMFDARRVQHPHRFDPERRADDYLLFGYGQHWCLGSYLGAAQLTQTFKALLRREGLRRVSGKAGRTQRIAVFPSKLLVEYAS